MPARRENSRGPSFSRALTRTLSPIKWKRNRLLRTDVRAQFTVKMSLNGWTRLVWPVMFAVLFAAASGQRPAAHPANGNTAPINQEQVSGRSLV